MAELYASLPVTTPDSIRVIEIIPGRPSDEIHISLLPASLDDAGLQYEALSYTWGTPENPKTVNCNGHTLKVTQNLHSALRRLRNEDRKRTFWIDAVCINQKNYREREEQVKIMRKIYEQASVVWADLGEAVENIQEMFRLMQALDQNLRQRDGDNLPLTTADFEQMGLPPTDSVGWVAWQELLSRPYFVRLWVIQEFAVATKLYFLIGLTAFPWWNLYEIIRRMQTHGIAEDQRPMPLNSTLALSAIQGKIAIEHLHAIRDEIQSYDRPRGMGDLLWLARFGHATDPKDKIYAILGLATDVDVKQPGLEIKYDDTESIADMYTRVACSLLRSDPDYLLKILYEAGSALNPRQPDLASWIPDWSSTRAGSPLGRLAHAVGYHAASSLSPEFSVDEAFKTLRLSGSIFDRISQTTYEYRPEIGSQAQRDDMYYGLEAAKWLQTSMKLAPAGDVYEPTGSSVQEALWRTLIGNKTHADTPAPDSYAEQFANLTVRQKFAEEALVRSVQNGTTFAVVDSTGEYSTAHKGSKLYRQALQNMMYTKMFGLTEEGYMGIFPSGTEAGDKVCLITGAEVPFVVRETSPAEWILIGECYVHGVMKGELLQGGDLSWQELRIV